MKSSLAYRLLLGPSVFCLIVCVVMSWIASPALAWGPAGHRIIASVAQQHLNARARARLAYVLGSETTLADVATWADDVRDERPETAPWHYINIPPAATDLRPQRDCPEGNCVSDKIREFVGIARLGVRNKSEVAEAVKYLIHFVADLHQPLHAGFAEDRGGNRLPVIVEGRESNLHSIWDSTIIRRLGSDEAEIAQHLNQGITPLQKKQWQKGRPREWAWESHLLAVRAAYGALPAGSPKRLDEDYLAQAAAVAEEQLAKAGIRLAAVINQVWPLGR